jgi:hypothetical protein
VIAVLRKDSDSGPLAFYMRLVLFLCALHSCFVFLLLGCAFCRAIFFFFFFQISEITNRWWLMNYEESEKKAFSLALLSDYFGSFSCGFWMSSILCAIQTHEN